MSEYHQETAYQRDAMWGHALDWAHQPNPFKEYVDQAPGALPGPRAPRAGFFDLIYEWPPSPARLDTRPDAQDLGAILLMSAGITSRSHLVREGLRSPASAGALYPSELYAAACGFDQLEDGLYHFDVQKPGLTRLWSAKLAAAVSRTSGAAPSQLSFFITTMFWRSVWKYRSRAFRYCLLDAGHMLANLELSLAACGLDPQTCLDFADRSAGALLSLPSQDEAALALVHAGPRPVDPGQDRPGLPPLNLRSRPLSTAIGRDQAVLSAYTEGINQRPGPPAARPQPAPLDGALKLPDPLRELDNGLWDDGKPTLLQVTRSRRSRRNFLPSYLSAELVSSLLAAALPAPDPIRAQVLLTYGPDMDGGIYCYQPQDNSLLFISGGCGDTLTSLGRSCLGQDWAAQAAMSLVLYADLEKGREMHGPREYRRAMIAAGRAGQRLYLAATALGLGCCGIGAFYDEEVARLALLPEGCQPLYVLSCGPVKNWPG